MTEDVQALSTSALAKKLGKSSKQMFAELEALGWMVRTEDGWSLTPKGQFEGGEYRESKRFGTYIVWPAAVTEHRALVNADSQLQTATALGKALNLGAVTINRLLCELGWIERYVRGWRLTEAGKRHGGRQSEDARSGTPYALWPRELPDNKAFAASVEAYRAGVQQDELLCLDGHRVRSAGARMIDNWLYSAGILHACNRRLPIDEEASADFYLPGANLFIEYWGEEENAQQLAEKMRKKSLYQRNGLDLIELDAKHLDDLEESLARQLLKRGIETL